LSIKLFADDAVLSMSDFCIEKLTRNINDELKKIDYWMGINKLSINYTQKKQIYGYFIFLPVLIYDFRF